MVTSRQEKETRLENHHRPREEKPGPLRSHWYRPKGLTRDSWCWWLNRPVNHPDRCRCGGSQHERWASHTPSGETEHHRHSTQNRHRSTTQPLLRAGTGNQEERNRDMWFYEGGSQGREGRVHSKMSPNQMCLLDVSRVPFLVISHTTCFITTISNPNLYQVTNLNAYSNKLVAPSLWEGQKLTFSVKLI